MEGKTCANVHSVSGAQEGKHCAEGNGGKVSKPFVEARAASHGTEKGNPW